nr:uncharacterized protein LOC109165874 [Ipomoea trifida]
MVAFSARATVSGTCETDSPKCSSIPSKGVAKKGRLLSTCITASSSASEVVDFLRMSSWLMYLSVDQKILTDRENENLRIGKWSWTRGWLAWRRMVLMLLTSLFHVLLGDTNRAMSEISKVDAEESISLASKDAGCAYAAPPLHDLHVKLCFNFVINFLSFALP